MRRFSLPIALAGCGWLVAGGVTHAAESELRFIAAPAPPVSVERGAIRLVSHEAPAVFPVAVAAERPAQAAPLLEDPHPLEAAPEPARRGAPAEAVAAPAPSPPPRPPAMRSAVASLNLPGGYVPQAQVPRRPPLQAATQSSFRRGKPFEAYQPEPTVSPYMHLYRAENDLEAAPNYYAFVRPQLDQQETNRTQQQEIQQLRGQMQSAGSANPFGAGPITGVRSRYMNTAQFYGSRR